MCDSFESKRHKPKKDRPKIPQQLKTSGSVKKVIYIDAQGVDWNNPGNTVRAAVDSGFNVILFAFYLNTGPFDFLLLWSQMSKDQQQSLVDYAHSRGALLGLSAGGGTEIPYTLDPVSYATLVSNFAVDNLLDLVEYDLENIQPGFVATGTTDLYAWIRTVNQTTRHILGSQRYITHAPQQPYLSVPGISGTWPGIRGGYFGVFMDSMEDGSAIDWLNVQTYNQGNNYSTYETVWQVSDLNFPYSAFNQLYQNGVGIPFDKLVYGSYLLPSDGSGGIYDPQRIHDAFVRARDDYGYVSGSMIWQWNSSGSPSPSQWLNTVYENL